MASADRPARRAAMTASCPGWKAGKPKVVLRVARGSGVGTIASRLPFPCHPCRFRRPGPAEFPYAFDDWPSLTVILMQKVEPFLSRRCRADVIPVSRRCHSSVAPVYLRCTPNVGPGVVPGACGSHREEHGLLRVWAR